MPRVQGRRGASPDSVAVSLAGERAEDRVPDRRSSEPRSRPSWRSSRARAARRRSEAIKHAREFGDLAENFEYHAAKNEQGLLERRIHALRERLRHAVTVEHDTDEHVGVGSIVEIADEDGETMEVEISARRRRRAGLPARAALMGAAVGDVVDVEAPRGSWKARVLAIRRGDARGHGSSSWPGSRASLAPIRRRSRSGQRLPAHSIWEDAVGDG